MLSFIPLYITDIPDRINAKLGGVNATLSPATQTSNQLYWRVSTSTPLSLVHQANECRYHEVRLIPFRCQLSVVNLIMQNVQCKQCGVRFTDDALGKFWPWTPPQLISRP